MKISAAAEESQHEQVNHSSKSTKKPIPIPVIREVSQSKLATTIKYAKFCLGGTVLILAIVITTILYLNTGSVVEASCVGAAIIFIGLLGFIYDWMVSRQFRRLQISALSTNAVLDELFPSFVRPALLKRKQISMSLSQRRGNQAPIIAEGGDTANNNVNEVIDISNSRRGSLHPLVELFVPFSANDRKNTDPNFKNSKRRRTSMELIGDSIKSVAVTNSVKKLMPFLSLDDAFASTDEVDSKPIAKMFPHATVLFADIAGFTKWSSAHSPVEVFELLEALFAIFDRCANTRGVFKVETIGDCYMAVSGIPDDDTVDHATNMADFALDMLDAMPQLRQSKGAEFMGPLEVRVGMHSGSVTAGVLRGAKSRFQLFGDTVNTASRMESTGRPSWIHLSASTVHYLGKEGSCHLVERRGSIVNPKGKGEMQTYWLTSRFRPAGVNMLDIEAGTFRVETAIDDYDDRRQRPEEMHLHDVETFDQEEEDYKGPDLV